MEVNPERSVWCWEHHRAAHRVLYDPTTGAVRRVWTVPPTTPMSQRMAGWVKGSKGSPVAIFTPDRHRVVVQRADVAIDLSNDCVETTRRPGAVWTTLTLRSPSTGAAIRLRELTVAKELRDPMDDGFLGLVENLALHRENRDVVLATWEPDATPDGFAAH